MILFCDFDGTLYRQQIDGDFERNLEAIKDFRRRGNKFVLTTGRGLSSISRTFPNYAEYVDYLICDNGSVCTKNGELFFEVTIKSELAKEIALHLKTHPRSDEFDIVCYRSDKETESVDDDLTKLRLWVVESDVMDEVLVMMREKFADYSVVFYGGHNLRPSVDRHEKLRDYHKAAIDVVSGKAGKENAIKRIVNDNFEHDIITVGDGGNDIEMLRMYDGYIMDTASSELRSQVNEAHVVESVSSLMRNLCIYDDIRKKTGLDIFHAEKNYYTDGATNATVFSVDNKILVKISDRHTVDIQREFLENNRGSVFQRIICCDSYLGYECFEFINGVHYQIGMMDARYAIGQIYYIVSSYKAYDGDGYGFLGDKKESWSAFLLDEIDFAKKRIPNTTEKYALSAVGIIGNNEPARYYLHGDFGMHNFLIENDNIKVIDPMTLIGDPVYDFYFAVFSDVDIMQKIDDEFLFSFFDKYPKEYLLAIITIVLFVRASRAMIYDAGNYLKYETLYMVFGKKLLK